MNSYTANLAKYPFVYKGLDMTLGYDDDVEFVEEHGSFTMLQQLQFDSLSEDERLLCKRVMCKWKAECIRRNTAEPAEPIEYTNKEEFEAYLAKKKQWLDRAMSVADQCAEFETVYIGHTEYNAGLLPNGEPLIVFQVDYLQKINGKMTNIVWRFFKEEQEVIEFTWLNMASPLFNGKIIP